jgi:hypothetical protein
MKPEDIFIKNPGYEISFISDQMDAVPSPTIDGGSKIFVLEYKNYFYPLENLSINEKSCKSVRKKT